MPEFDWDKPSDREAMHNIMGQQAQQTTRRAGQEQPLHNLPMRTRFILAGFFCFLILIVSGGVKLEYITGWLQAALLLGLIIYFVKNERSKRKPKE